MARAGWRPERGGASGTSSSGSIARVSSNQINSSNYCGNHGKVGVPASLLEDFAVTAGAGAQ